MPHHHYPEQLQALADIDAAFLAGFRAPILVAVTGWGKTHTAVEYIRRQLHAGRRIWFLAHLDSILLATAERLDAAQIEFGWLWSSQPTNSSAQVRLVSVATAARRLDALPPTDLVIIDECDLAIAASYQRILDALGRPRILGLTGTPIRADGRPMRDGGFDHLIRTQDPIELINAKRLSPLRMWSFPLPEDLSKIKIVGGDYDQQAAGEVMSRPAILGDALEHWQRLCITDGKIRPTGIFCSSIKSAEKTAAKWREAGYKAVAVHGKSPQEIQKEAIPRFERGEYHALVTVDKYIAGVDLPCMAALVCLRKTKSLRVWLQMIGRVLRISPEWEDALCLDHVGNLRMAGIGNPLEKRMASWSLDGYSRAKRNKGAATSIEVCDQCYSCDVKNGKCNECGYQRQRGSHSGFLVIRGDLTEVNLDPRQAIKEQRKKEKIELQKKRKREEAECVTLEDWIRLGESRPDYKNPRVWARIRFTERQKRKCRPRAGPVFKR